MLHLMLGIYLELNLEETPKWHLLSMVLDEIFKETKNNGSSCQFPVGHFCVCFVSFVVLSVTEQCNILIVANDDRTCMQLRQVLWQSRA